MERAFSLGVVSAPRSLPCEQTTEPTVAIVRLEHLPATQAKVFAIAHNRRPQSFVAKHEGSKHRPDVVEFLDSSEAVEADPIIRDTLASMIIDGLSGVHHYNFSS